MVQSLFLGDRKGGVLNIFFGGKQFDLERGKTNFGGKKLGGKKQTLRVKNILGAHKNWGSKNWGVN